MQDTGLRWGGIIGGFGVIGGVLSYVLGGVLAPAPKGLTTPEVVSVLVFVRGMLVLVVLGIVLGLSYYAGLRVGMDLLQEPELDEDAPADRLGPVLAGGLVMFLYWLATTLYVYLFPPFGTRDSSLKAFLIHLVLGAVFIGLGAGLGGVGGRSPAARRLLSRVAVVPRVSRVYSDGNLVDGNSAGIHATQPSAAPLSEGTVEGEGWAAPTSES